MKDMLKLAVQTYNKIAKIYSERTYPKIVQFQATKFMSLLKGKKILDVGCGSGRDVEYFLHEGYEPIGIDLSENMLKEARKRVKAKNVFKKMDFTDLKFKEETFDGVWVMAALYHIPRKSVTDVLRGFNKVLKKGGLIYIAVEEGEGQKEVKEEKYGNEPRPFTYFNEKEMHDFLYEAGFKIIGSEVNDTNDEKWIEIFARKEE